MKSLHISPHLDEEAAGPTQSVVRLCESLVSAGDQVELHTMASGRLPKGVDLRVHQEWRYPRRFGFSLNLIPRLRSAVNRVDVVHNHSLWSFPNMAAGLACNQSSILVTSPRGTLSSVARARSRLKKLIFSPLQTPALQRAACLHATSEMELADIRECGFRQPIVMLPNGIDVPPLRKDTSVDRERRRLLFLGRLHPIKGIELLLDAWGVLEDRFPDWELFIVGKGEMEYTNSLCEHAKRLRLSRCTFHDAVYGDEKDRMYRSSDLFILPTFTENFGMAVAESLAYAVPVITTKGAPWSGLETTSSGWWIERNIDSFVATLESALITNPSSLEQMGLNGREWMLREFDWRAISISMSSVYHWLTHGGQPPPTVNLV